MMTQVAPSPTEIDELQAACRSCRDGLELLDTNMYRYPESTQTAPPDGRRAWSDVFGEFRRDRMQAVGVIGTFLATHRGEPVVAAAEKAVAEVGTASSWEDAFSGNGGIIQTGGNIWENCPGNHLSRFDCVSGPARLRVTIDKVRDVLARLEKIEGIPEKGWAQVRKLTDPKITIMGSAAVSESAMDVVKHVYSEMTSRFTSAFPRSTMDGYTVYLTNGEPWSEMGGLTPVAAMMGTEGEELRGGTGPDYLWIDEQMICKKGVRTRNEAFEAKKRAERDDTERTYDQVVHEFSHAIDFRFGLRGRILEVFKGGWNPVEQFPWAVQHWFGTPSGTLTDGESAFIGEIFGSTTTFSPDLYKP